MKNRFLVAVFILALTGCATKAKWEHPQAIKSGNSEDVATMALADCEAYAAGRTPMPQTMPYMPVPAPTTYSTTGTFNQYGNYGTYQGTTTASGFASGYAAGANMGANIANSYLMAAAAERQEKLTSACMRSLGWVDTSTPEGAQKLKDTVAKNGESAQAGSRQNTERPKQDTAEIEAFFDWAAARPAPNAINYRTDRAKFDALMSMVPDVASSPEHRGKPFIDILRISHYRVVQEGNSTN